MTQKMSVKLHIAAKDIISQFGKDTIITNKFVNLLSDFNAFNEYPSTKEVLKTFIKEGYSSQLHALLSLSRKEFIQSSDFVFKNFKTNCNYKKDVATYVCDCFLFALGYIEKINEPITRGFDARVKKGNILSTLDEQLKDLKALYLSNLEKLIILPEDLLHDASPYYSTKALTILYGIEAKISVINNQLGNTDDAWCTENKQKKLEEASSKKNQVIDQIIRDEKKKYSDLLDKLIVHHKSFFIKRSSSYTPDGDSQLSIIEKNIIDAYQERGVTYDNWCENEKKKMLDANSVSNNNIAKQAIIKIATPAALLLTGGVMGTSYVGSQEALEKYDKTIAQADAFAEQNDFSNAIELYDAAAHYDGSFRTGHYQDEAKEKIVSLLERVKFDCDKLIDEKHFAKVATLLSNIPEDVKEEETYKELKSDLYKKLEIQKVSYVDSFVTAISEKSKLSPDLMTVLDELLVAFPNDYWLNFIKKKEQK